MTVPATIATIDHDLGELTTRRDRSLDLIQRCLTDIANIEYRCDVLLQRRSALTKLTKAAESTMLPHESPVE